MPSFGNDVLLYTAVDDPEYVEFISNLNDPTKYDVDGICLSFVFSMVALPTILLKVLTA